jgi:hypothetical protein
MPDTTITGLPNATTPLSGTERVAMDQSGVTRDATTQDIADLAPYPPVVDGVNDGLMTSLQAIKLNEIEPMADRTTEARVLMALDGATIDNAILNDALVTATALTDGATPSIDATVAPLRTWTLGANGRTPSITWGAATAARSITLLINGNGFNTINWSTIAPTWVGAAPAISSTGVTAVTFMRVDGVTYGFGPPPATDQPLFFDAAEFIPRTTNGCGISSEETATNRINRDLLTFDPGAIEYAQKGFVWPAGWATATATFFWKASSGVGSCVWAARMRVFTDSDDQDQAMGTAQSVTDAAVPANYHQQTSATAAITPSGFVVSGRHCILEIYRDATNGSDDLSVDALLIGVALTKAS